MIQFHNSVFLQYLDWNMTNWKIMIVQFWDEWIITLELEDRDVVYEVNVQDWFIYWHIEFHNYPWYTFLFINISGIVTPIHGGFLIET